MENLENVKNYSLDSEKKAFFLIILMLKFKKIKITIIFNFSWSFKVFKLGCKRDIIESDLWQPLEELKSDAIGAKMEKLWKEESKKRKPSLLKVLLNLSKWQLILIGIITGIYQLTIR